MTFKDCKNAGSCGKDLCLPEFCHQFDPIQKTNAERIWEMSDEELAAWIIALTIGGAPRPWCDFHCRKNGKYGCEKCALKWLQQPAEEVTHYDD